MELRVTAAMLLITGVVSAGKPASDFGTYKDREIRKSDVWMNSAPVTLKSQRGKVVVIDFWAFDCEPCVEAMPHIVNLYDKYGREGLVVIGIHTPRVEYEKDVSKLREAIARMGITFPVVVDNKQKIWRDYLCDLWPSQFVIDRDGIVRYSHGGVGRYEEMEQVIGDLLRGR